MPFRVRFGLTQQVWKTGGWGENFWNSGTDINNVKTDCLELSTLRNAFTPPQTLLTGFRISAYSGPRQVMNKTGWQGNAGPGGMLNATSDYPSTALQLKFTSAGGQTTTQWMRGIPDEIVKQGYYDPAGLSNWGWKIAAFLTQLQNSNWQMRTLDPANLKQPAGNFDPVLGILQYDGTQMGVDGALVKVRISRFTSPSAINGVWLVRCNAGPPQSVTLIRWTPLPSGTIVAGTSPTITKQTYILQTIKTAVIGDATSHYTGKPGALLGGKKRKKKKIGV